MSKIDLPEFINKINITKDKIPYYVIAVLLLLAFVNFQTSNPQTIVSNIRVSPTAANPKQNTPSPSDISNPAFEIESTHPADKSKALISDTRSNISITVNQALSSSDISVLGLSTTPPMTFKTVVHVNKKTLYFVPFEYWKNDTEYKVSVLLRGKRIHFFSFTTTNIPDKSEMKIDLGP
jgi:hypothetical protein